MARCDVFLGPLEHLLEELNGQRTLKEGSDIPVVRFQDKRSETVEWLSDLHDAIGLVLQVLRMVQNSSQSRGVANVRCDRIEL